MCFLQRRQAMICNICGDKLHKIKNGDYQPHYTFLFLDAMVCIKCFDKEGGDLNCVEKIKKTKDKCVQAAEI